ncbi:hypothetical protein [Streptomyces sp. MMBL 11-1]|uniref:hypothetical protein n=1 Tax=Streptomyces sp. MMBL 11-1 TaxID=3026420 RepID=UPI00235FAE69|nr:hypothetical protein [Streptomyces sp. MMBL 11-1]
MNADFELSLMPLAIMLPCLHPFGDEITPAAMATCCLNSPTSAPSPRRLLR